MEPRSKWLLGVFFIFIGIVVVWQFYHTVIRRDYEVYDYVSCDPAAASCFVYCDGECAYDDPYLKIHKHAQNIAMCDPTKEECPELSCGAGEADCAMIACSDGTLDEGEQCYTEPYE
jgi:hypothetical protein